MTLQRLFLSLRARWVLVALFGVLGTVSSGVLCLVLPKTYLATSTLMIRWVGPDPEVGDFSHARYAANRAATYSVLAQNQDVLAGTAEALGASFSVDELKGKLSSRSRQGSSLIEIKGSDSDPNRARDISVAGAKQIIRQIEIFEDVESSATPTIEAVLSVEAHPPGRPVAPRASSYLIIGAFAGLTIGTLVALLRPGRLKRERPRSTPREAVVPKLPVGPGPLWGLPKAKFTWAHVVWIILLAAAIPWRKDIYFEGGIDPVVVSKAVLGTIALAISALLAIRTKERLYNVAAAPLIIIAVYLVITLVGGSANDALMASTVLATRVAMILVTICLLVARYGIHESTRCFIHILAAITTVAALSGLTARSSRLGGVIPPLTPNVLAFFASILCLWVVAKAFTGRDSLLDGVCFGLLVAVVLLTGSRTSIVALGVSIGVMGLRATALNRRTVLAFSAAIPAAVGLAVSTGVLTAIFLRGGKQQVTTFSNRTIAWNAAMNLVRDPWQTLTGQGLVQKKIPVPGQWWDTQLLDSTWISALVQGGILGLVVVAVFSLSVALRALFLPRSRGPLWVGLAVLTVFRGFLESGTFDSTAAFLVFTLTAIAAYEKLSPAAAHHLAVVSQPPQEQESRPELMLSGAVT